MCGAACVCECVLMAFSETCVCRLTENDTKRSSNCGLFESSTDRNQEKNKLMASLSVKTLQSLTCQGVRSVINECYWLCPMEHLNGVTIKAQCGAPL